ncbi:cytochrome P450 [Aspergillus bertholletiae]|uniref:Cytochrome P450 n=1 Tax=Aspergillus bertholletiae TaxID=1226010 RepID=A0A5N7B055_9EURO|nr:cytochrome P450 [Aspergillus bertholletiae]
MDTLWLLAAASGIATHLLVFRFGEWDVKAPRVVGIYLLFSAALLYLERVAVQDHATIATSPKWAITVTVYHICGVYTSMLFYRAFCHRLRGYPGPFLARLSNFYVTFLSAKKLHLYGEIQRLHRQYGDYVRIGPTELSITDPKAVKALYSGQATVSKGPWYTVSEPRVSLQTARDRKEHARRRKVWDQAFSSKALRDYEPRVSSYIVQLLEAVRKNVGNPMDMAKWFNYYSFDVMGDLSFGKPFDMLVGGQDTYFSKQVHADMKSVGLFSHLTWLFPFFKRIPILNAEFIKFWNWIEGRVEERIKNTPDRPDVFSWILDAFQKGPKTKQDHLDLHGDANLIIVAGSDTTAAMLTSLFFHLAVDPTWQAKLQAELDELSDLSHESLTSIKLLDALINETMRLHPAVPSGTQRKTPSEGLHIGDKYIPGDVIVCIPSHTLFRDERVFVRPEEFLPERWTTQPELVKDASAFIPFNAGPYSCVGKQLALMELRCVTAEILSRYTVEFAKEQTVDDFLDGKRDAFTLVTGPLKLVFQER